MYLYGSVRNSRAEIQYILISSKDMQAIVSNSNSPDARGGVLAPVPTAVKEACIDEKERISEVLSSRQLHWDPRKLKLQPHHMLADICPREGRR